jgi:hypothetical protein
MTVPERDMPEEMPSLQPHQHHQLRQPLVLTKRDMITKLNGRYASAGNHIAWALRRHKLIKLKNGLYIETRAYLREPDKIRLTEYLASRIYSPSYISVEYVLIKCGMLMGNHHTATPAITSVTSKSTRNFMNYTGKFVYQNIASEWRERCSNIGIEETSFLEYSYRMATKARALFDYLYLYKGLHHRNHKQRKNQLLHDLGIAWGNFSEKDLEEFGRCVWRSGSKKMMDVLAIIRDYLEERGPDALLESLL